MNSISQKQALLLLPLCLFAAFVQSQTPAWLIGTWERKVKNEDGDFLVRYAFTPDTCRISSVNRKTKQKDMGKGQVLAFENPMLRIRMDTCNFEGIVLPPLSPDYIWEMNIKLMDPKTLRIIEQSVKIWGEAPRKEITYFKKK